VLASTYALPADAGHGKSIQNFFTFRITYPRNRLWRRLAGMPLSRTLYASGSSLSQVLLDAHLPYPASVDIADLVENHINYATDVFDAVHSNGRIHLSLMRNAGRLWGSRANDVTKFRKAGEYHIPTWDKINLTDHIAEATNATGWRRTKGN
jgi:hypothetical protein